MTTDGCFTALVGAVSVVCGYALSQWREWERAKEVRSSQDQIKVYHPNSPFAVSHPLAASLERTLSQSSYNHTEACKDPCRDPIGVIRQVSNPSPAAPSAMFMEVDLQEGLQCRKIYGLGGFCKHNRVLLCMVGMPARGKSYIVNMLQRYLRWTGFPVEAFNAGNLRRQEGLASIDANFFRNDDREALARRENIASRCMEAALAWLESQDDSSVAIFDATNTTRGRRQGIMERCVEIPGITPVFVESICTDPKVLEANYAMKLQNNDYKGMDPEKAHADFLKRVKMYEERYEPIEDDEGDNTIRYIKLFNVGQKVVLRHCDGYAPSHIGFYLSNIHITPRRIWLAGHAQSEDDVKGILGGVSSRLTDAGRFYCSELALHMHRTAPEIPEGEGRQILVLIGTAPVHEATARAMSHEHVASPSFKTVRSKEAAEAAASYPVTSTSLLNELDGGDCNGLTHDVMKSKFPAVWAARQADKLNFRYPGAGGESYIDVINRLRPVIVELERQHCSVLIISHLAVQRCIYAYFTGCPVEKLPYIPLKMHTLYELNPGPHGTSVDTINLCGAPIEWSSSRSSWPSKRTTSI